MSRPAWETWLLWFSLIGLLLVLSLALLASVCFQRF